jgi:hypothetical protein
VQIKSRSAALGKRDPVSVDLLERWAYLTRNPSVSDALSQLWPAAGRSADLAARIQRLLATQRDHTLLWLHLVPHGG